MEYQDVYDKNFNKTNKIVQRGDKTLNDNEYIMVFVIFIKNEDKYLIQKVSPKKGDYYSTTGGHVQSGEDPYSCMLRETIEEIGLDLSNDKVELVGRRIVDFKHAIFNVFYIEKDVDISNLKLQEDEVESVDWYTEVDVLKLIEEKKMLESHSIAFKQYILKEEV